MSAAKRYETVYKFKILDFKTRNGGQLKQIFYRSLNLIH